MHLARDRQNEQQQTLLQMPHQPHQLHGAEHQLGGRLLGTAAHELYQAGPTGQQLQAQGLLPSQAAIMPGPVLGKGFVQVPGFSQTNVQVRPPMPTCYGAAQKHQRLTAHPGRAISQVLHPFGAGEQEWQPSMQQLACRPVLTVALCDNSSGLLC